MRRLATALVVWLATGSFALGASQEAQAVTAERLRAAYGDARAALEEALGVDFEPPLEMRLVDAAALAECIAAENLPMIRLRQPDEHEAAAEARILAEQLAQVVYAKYAWSSREFLVVPDTWELTATVLGRPALTDDAALRAVMVHELVHALDDRRFDLGALLLGARTVDAVQGLNALVEGHAQHHTRRICAARGWEAGFTVFADAVGAIPASAEMAGEVVMTLLRMQAANMSFAYHAGERFVAELDAAGGAATLARAFCDPPRDGETILHPAWWLDPKLRPAVLYDPEQALDRFVARFDAALWSCQRMTLQTNQLAAALALLPVEETASIAASIRNARAVSLNPTAAPDSKIAIAVVMEFEDDAAAQAFVEASARVSRLKDETMKTGTARITRSTTGTVERPDAFGYVQQKRMQNGFLQFDVVSIDVVRGKLVVETLYSGDPPPNDEHLALALELLDSVKLRETK